MTKILLDQQIFDLQEFGGISRYFTELCIGLMNEVALEIELPLFYTDNIHFTESEVFEDSFQHKNSFLVKYSQVFRPFLPRKLKKKGREKILSLLQQQDFDLFVPTYYDPYFLAYLKDKPFVLTVHDMIHELYPAYFTADQYTVPNKKLLIEKATKIIAISESTKRDILKIYPAVDGTKIEVVYLAHASKNENVLPLNLPDKYILFVGNRSIYKNFDFFLQAIAPILQDNPDLYIVCAGGPPLDLQELEMIDQLAIAGRVIQQNFKDSELESYYKQALCFVFPSAYEGFGIPVLEAMAAGCPIVLTNNSSFPEVAGDAGIYFELNDATDLRNKVKLLLSDKEFCDIHRQKGMVQAGKFNWERTIAGTFKVYQQAISNTLN